MPDSFLTNSDLPVVLIFTEAGEGIGFGHLTRCTAIKNAAAGMGVTCKLFVQWFGPAVSSEDQVSLDWLAQKELLLQELDPAGYVLIDSYKATADRYLLVKEHCRKLAVLDDYNRLIYPCDLLINPNVYFSQVDYSNQRALCVGGELFVILRAPFRYLSESEERTSERVVVTVGGSDTYGLLPLICEVLRNNGSDNVQVICPAEPDRKKLARLFPEFLIAGALTEHEMFEAFNNAAWVVSSCGQSLHELASLGKPTIAIRAGQDQVLNQAYYYHIGFINELLNHEQIYLQESLTLAMKAIFSDERKERCCVIKQNFFRNGVQQVFHAILNIPALNYRLANESDAVQYFIWANDEAVRKNAFSTKPIEWLQHVQWFQKKLKSRSLMLLFFFNQEPAGQVRIDWVGDEGYIDFSVDASYRGKGLGTAFLQSICSFLEKAKGAALLYAEVKEDNAASMRAFEKAGFRVAQKNDDKKVATFTKQISV